MLLIRHVSRASRGLRMSATAVAQNLAIIRLAKRSILIMPIAHHAPQGIRFKFYTRALMQRLLC
jgi:hypothetical protein